MTKEFIKKLGYFQLKNSIYKTLIKNFRLGFSKN